MVRGKIADLGSTQIRERILKALIEPIRERRTYEASSGESSGDLWTFALLDKDVGLAYSGDGYGAAGLPWGLVFLASSHYGTSGAWYPSLHDLIKDCGYFQA